MNWDTVYSFQWILENGLIEFCLVIAATFYASERVFDLIFHILTKIFDWIWSIDDKRKSKEEFNSSNEDLNNSLTCNRVEKEQEGSISR